MRLLVHSSKPRSPSGRRSKRFTSITSASVLLRSLRYLSAALLIVSITYQFLQYGRDDPYKCESLLTRGRWHHRKRVSAKQPVAMTWRSDDCLSHSFRGPTLEECLSGHHLVFAGDSTVRQLYWAALRRLDLSVGKRSLEEFALLEDRHINLSKEIRGVRVEFLWDPWLNGTALFGQLARFRDKAGTSKYEALVKQEGRQSPALIVLGTPSLWAARRAKVKHLEAFKEGIRTIRHWLRVDISDNVILPSRAGTAGYGELSNHVVLAPVPEPAWEKLTYDRQMMTPEKVEKMNLNLSQSAVVHQSHVLWGFNAMTKARKDAFLDDGIHVIDEVADQRLDVVLNLRCNAGLATHKLPNQVTCCVPYQKPGIVQLFLLGLAILGLPWLAVYKEEGGSHSARVERAIRAVVAFSALLVTAAYCFLADRTHLFSKQEKNFSLERFLLSLVGLCVLFLLSTRRVDAESATEKTTRHVDFLPRAQTDEWRGWMQGFLLLYNFHGASMSPGWYKVSRLLLSTYIFLSCYGHTHYFLRTKDYSWRRVVTVLCRINILSLVLVFVTNTPWTLYYFCPLTTAWFLMTYLVLSTRAHLNTSPTGMYWKILVAAAATTLVIQARGMIGGIQLALEKGLGIAWDLETIRHNLAIDQFVPYFGIIAAALSHRLSYLRRPGESKPEPSPSSKSTVDAVVDRILWSVIRPGNDAIHIKAAMTLLSSIVLVFFFIVAFGASFHIPSSAYDSYHPYVGPWLVLAAIILRNCHPALRSFQITGAVGLGRLSLETSILQYHALLAGDASAILRIFSAKFQATLLGMMLKNCQTAVLVVVFLWACVKCRTATQQITSLLATWIDGEGRKQNRNPEVLPKACYV